MPSIPDKDIKKRGGFVKIRGTAVRAADGFNKVVKEDKSNAKPTK